MIIKTIADTTPASASTAVGSSAYGLSRYRCIRIEANLIGATGGALDVYLQRKLDDNLWADWCHFAQIAAAGAAVRYTLTADIVNATAGAITATTTSGNDATPSVTLAANNFLAGHPGDAIRAVYVAGASTSAGAAARFTIIGIGPETGAG